MKVTRQIILVGAVCVIGAVLVALRLGDSADGKAPAPVGGKTVRLRPPSALASAHRTKPFKPRPIRVEEEDEDDDDRRTPAEKALAERIEKASDDEDFGLAVSCADEAQKCAVVEIRQAMVETLGRFGAKALPELTPFLADADEDVRESAKNEWMMALEDIDDVREKLRVVELAMGVLSDEDALEEISGEFIGADEDVAVASLVRVIKGGGSAEGIAKAKEMYEFVTGDEWTE